MAALGGRGGTIPGMDELPSDDPVTVRAARWLQATPAEMIGLAVLVLGAIAASWLLWVQATQRPSELPSDAATIGAELNGQTSEHDLADGHGHGHPADPDASGGGAGDASPDPAAPDGHGRGDPATAGAGEPGGNGALQVGVDPDGEVAVHVTGAVHRPGLVMLRGPSRVADAVAAAGGMTDAAAPELINLARPVTDGEHVHVPVEGEDPLPIAPSGPASGDGHADGGGGGPDGHGGAPQDGAAGSDGLVDINRAGVAELQTLPGIGPARAQAIVDHRETHGPFAQPGDLRAVSGIGEVTFQNIAGRVTAG